MGSRLGLFCVVFALEFDSVEACCGAYGSNFIMYIYERHVCIFVYIYFRALFVQAGI